MPKTAPEAPRTTSQAGSVSIIASRYNGKYADALVKSAAETLANLAPDLDVNITRVPGAFEIPIAVEAAACRDVQPLAIIALGVIIRGSTAHADLIAQSVTQSLQETGVSHLIPVIHEVLLVENSEQAKSRTIGDEFNRGREAAEAAISMIKVMGEFL